MSTRFEALVRQHRSFLEGLARKLCRKRFDSDDLVQDVLERAFKSFDGLPVEANGRAWLARIMHNRFIDLVRRQQSDPVQVPVDEHVLPAREPAAHAGWERITPEQVRAKVAELPDDLRQVYECHAELSLSYQEIAARLDIPMGTVGTRLLRARRHLRELLLSEIGQGEDSP